MRKRCLALVSPNWTPLGDLHPLVRAQIGAAASRIGT